jgi:hypothetical protein
MLAEKVISQFVKVIKIVWRYLSMDQKKIKNMRLVRAPSGMGQRAGSWDR